jgi:hypothetical protein
MKTLNTLSLCICFHDACPKQSSSSAASHELPLIASPPHPHVRPSLAPTLLPKGSSGSHTHPASASHVPLWCREADRASEDVTKVPSLEHYTGASTQSELPQSQRSNCRLRSVLQHTGISLRGIAFGRESASSGRGVSGVLADLSSGNVLVVYKASYPSGDDLKAYFAIASSYH